MATKLVAFRMPTDIGRIVDTHRAASGGKLSASAVIVKLIRRGHWQEEAMAGRNVQASVDRMRQLRNKLGST